MPVASPLLVTAAIIRDDSQGKYLIARRRGEDRFEGGKWEFPGGKVEELIREIMLRELAAKRGLGFLKALGSPPLRVKGKRNPPRARCSHSVEASESRDRILSLELTSPGPTPTPPPVN